MIAKQGNDMNLADRLVALWNHLGLERAHVAAQMPGDIIDFIAGHPGRVGGIVLCAPTRLDPAPFTQVADRLLMIAGETGPTEDVTTRALPRLPGAVRTVLAGYDAPGWADICTDRADEVAGAICGFLDQQATAPAGAVAGAHAGISYHLEGSGPVLVLFPFFLAPAQWEPAIPLLAERFTVVTLGGAHVGGVAALEDRAHGPSYRAMALSLFDMLAPPAGAPVLDVGCGSGALDRLFAQRFANPLVATDINPFLRREAAALADGFDIRFEHADAEALPFPNDYFGAAFTVTVLEECDADRALAELRRVVRPGGRVGVVVRAIDMPQWWNLELPDALRARAETPPHSVGRRGVADASLYRRMRAAGFVDVVGMPALVTFDRPGSPIWRHREDHVLSQLSPAETETWHELSKAARRDGVLMMANPLHVAIGRK